MNKFLMILTLAVTAPLAFAANELDQDVKNQKSLAGDLPKTVVVRVNKTNGEVAVLQSKVALEKSDKLDESQFVAVKSTERLSSSELDKDSSTSGWYFYWYGYNYYAPTYYYYGYNYYYRPYCNYYYGNYHYYYYNWNSWYY